VVQQPVCPLSIILVPLDWLRDTEKACTRNAGAAPGPGRTARCTVYIGGREAHCACLFVALVHAARPRDAASFTPPAHAEGLLWLLELGGISAGHELYCYLLLGPVRRLVFGSIPQDTQAGPLHTGLFSCASYISLLYSIDVFQGISKASQVVCYN